MQDTAPNSAQEQAEECNGPLCLGHTPRQTHMGTVTEKSQDPDGILLQGAAMPWAMQPAFPQ